MAGLTDVATNYHEVHLTQDPARAVVWSTVAEYLARYVPADSAVLDIGAGYCDWINFTRAKRRLAVDVWPGIAAYAAPGVETQVLNLVGGLRSLGTGVFDAVLASNVLEHFGPGEVDTVVADVAAVLRPGGRLLAIQPNFRYAWKHYFDDYTHRSVFTHVSLPALLKEHGFRVREVRPKFLPYSMRESRVPIRPWLIRAYLASPVKPLAGQMLVVAEKE